MLKITEVLPNPDGADKGAEYIMVRNTGSEPVLLSGWSITIGTGKKIPVRGGVEPGGTLKVLTGGVALKNTGDTLTLLNAQGGVADVFLYAAAGRGRFFSRLNF